MSPAPKLPNFAVDLQWRLPFHVIGHNVYDADGHYVSIGITVQDERLQRDRAEAIALVINTACRDQIAPHLREVAA